MSEQQQPPIILPLYIQKQIIKIICVFINRNYKEIEPIGLSVDYRDNEAEIKQLTFKISLVCHDWFKTLKNNLNVSVDFNFKQPTTNNNNNNNNYYSIIDINNIEILKLHYDHNKPTNDNQYPGMFYEMIRQPGGSVNKYVRGDGGTSVKECDFKQKEREIPMHTVNEQLKLLSQYNLKKLIFRNINADKNLKILNSLYPCEALSNVHCLEFEVNRETTVKDIQELNRKVKKLFSIIVNDCTDMNVLLECFKTWSSSIKQFYIVSLTPPQDDQDVNQDINDQQSPFLIFNLLTGIHSTVHDKQLEIHKMNKINYFSNIRFFEMYGMVMTIDDVTTILKGSYKSIQHLSISICFDKLVYFLSGRQDRKDHLIRNCECSSVLRSTDDTDQFNLEWIEFSKYLEKCNQLKVLSISHECGDKGESLDYEQEFLPSFINVIVQLLSLPKSLEKFGMVGPRHTGIFYEIASTLKSITHFSSNIVNTHFHSTIDFRQYVGKLENLVRVHPHIQQFKFSKFEYVKVNDDDEENDTEMDPLDSQYTPNNPFEDLNNEYTFKEIVLFDYNKK